MDVWVQGAPFAHTSLMFLIALDNNMLSETIKESMEVNKVTEHVGELHFHMNRQQLVSWLGSGALYSLPVLLSRSLFCWLE